MAGKSVEVNVPQLKKQAGNLEEICKNGKSASRKLVDFAKQFNSKSEADFTNQIVKDIEIQSETMDLVSQVAVLFKDEAKRIEKKSNTLNSKF